MSTGIDYTYRYAFASSFDTLATGSSLCLSTSSGKSQNPYFFEGRIKQPRLVADMMLVLSQVVRTHFFQPRPPMMDPVLTSSESILRLEGFSGCCGVYVRADLPASMFEGELKEKGTTNVDFNDPMRMALTRVKDQDRVQFAVGKEGVVLSTENETVIEKKVKLPIRWIKGFSEVQVYQPSLSLVYEIPAPDALRFMRTLPNSGIPKRPSFVTQFGKTLRLSQRVKPGYVQLHGTHRIKVLEPLLHKAKSLRIWADKNTGISAWEVISKPGGFFLMISPEVHRGFSGEGQLLDILAKGEGQSFLSYIQAQLNWQPHIDPIELAGQLNTTPTNIESALAILGTRGLAGYDVSQGAYFHRELPFMHSLTEKLQPRLINARKLVAEQKIKVHKQIDAHKIDLLVQGSSVEHFVRLRPEGDRCSCPWFSKYLGQRGTCKHILASRLFTESFTKS